MKNKMNIVRFFSIPLFAVCIVMFASCKDEQQDYRDKWQGSYAGESSLHLSSGSDYQFDTVYLNDTITVSKMEENKLMIQYRSQEFQVNCTPQGNLTSATNNPHSEWSGNIVGDSLYFDYYDVSQGHSSSWHFKGKKR